MYINLKVYIFWEFYKTMTKSTNFIWRFLRISKKKFGDFAIFLWPSQNICTYQFLTASCIFNDGLTMRLISILVENHLSCRRWLSNLLYVPWIQIITKLFVRGVILLLLKPRNYFGHKKYCLLIQRNVHSKHVFEFSFYIWSLKFKTQLIINRTQVDINVWLSKLV